MNNQLNQSSSFEQDQSFQMSKQNIKFQEEDVNRSDIKRMKIQKSTLSSKSIIGKMERGQLGGCIAIQIIFVLAYYLYMRYTENYNNLSDKEKQIMEKVVNYNLYNMITTCVAIILFLYFSIKDNNKYELWVFLELTCFLPMYFSITLYTILIWGIKEYLVLLLAITYYAVFFTTIKIIWRNFLQMQNEYTLSVLVRIGLDKNKRHAFKVRQKFNTFLRLHIVTLFFNFFNEQYFLYPNPFQMDFKFWFEVTEVIFSFITIIWGYYAAKYENKSYTYVFITATLAVLIHTLYQRIMLVQTSIEKDYYDFFLTSKGFPILIPSILTVVMIFSTIIGGIYFGLQSIKMYKHSIRDLLYTRETTQSTIQVQQLSEQIDVDLEISYEDNNKILYEEKDEMDFSQPFM